MYILRKIRLKVVNASKLLSSGILRFAQNDGTLLWSLLISLLSTPVVLAESVKLSSSEKLEAVYFKDQKRWRHLRGTLGIRQETEYSDNLSSVFQGRIRYDGALSPYRLSPQRDLSLDVRNDELFEAEFRDFYFNYTGQSFSLRTGLIKFDWIETLAPQSADFVTPMDVRHGVYGDSDDVILRSLGADLTHKFILDSQLEWLIMKPRTSKTPAGKNGYGLYEYLQDEIPGRTLVFSDEEIPENYKHLEAGLRMMKSIPNVDFSLFAYRGHGRVPNLRVRPLMTETQTGIQRYYSPINTFGGFASATLTHTTVARVFGLFEPDRAPALGVVTADGRTRDSDPTRRYRIGIGFDQMILDDLKFYSEWYLTKIESTHSGELRNSSADSEREDYAVSYRLSYDATSKWQVLFDGIATVPERSYLLAPQTSWQFDTDYRLFGGMRFVKSFSDKSQLDILRATSHFFVGIEHKTAIAP